MITCVDCGRVRAEPEELHRWGISFEEDHVTPKGVHCPDCFKKRKAECLPAMPPEPATAGPGWYGRTDRPVLMWDGPLDFSSIPDDPREARRVLSAKLQSVGDQLWAAMRALKEWA